MLNPGRFSAARVVALKGKTHMQFRDMPAQPGNKKVVLIGIVAAAIAAAAIAGDDRISAALAGAALLGVGLLLVLPVRNPA